MGNMTSNNHDDNSVSHLQPEDIKGIWKQLVQFFYELLDIRQGTDQKGTIEDIKGNISMKGHTAWVLVFSILIASIGLNISSSAVELELCLYLL